MTRIACGRSFDKAGFWLLYTIPTHPGDSVAIVAGVDFGTQSVRVALVDSERGPLGGGIAEYEVHRRKDDPDFAKSPRARLDFFYRRHPAWDAGYNRYPVLRTDVAPN